VRLFFDNCISVALARAVAELARAQDIEVIHLSDRFSRDTRDEDWMIALRPEGWIIISGDARISRGKTERAAWHESGLTAFFLGDGWASKKHWVQATELVRWMPIIIETSTNCRPGSGFLLPFKGKAPKAIYEP
jgi:hypothetical protein